MYTVTALDTSVRSKSTGAAVAELIREASLCGEYAEGERLPEGDLARRYGVSRIPMREALQLLKGEGLVTGRRESRCAGKGASAEGN